MKRTLTEFADKNGKTIRKGSVVRYQDGWVKVTSIQGAAGRELNLGGIFNGKIYHKGVSLTDVYEDEANWYSSWQQSETYKCM